MSYLTNRGATAFFENDRRFAYIHGYYHASIQLKKIDFLLKELHHSSLPPLHVRLGKTESGNATSGVGWKDEVSIKFAKPMFDISLLAHEVGHSIHGQFLQKDFSVIIPDIKDVPDVYRKLSVLEGVANLLSVLYLKQPFIGNMDWYESFYSVDTFIKFNNLPSLEFIWSNRLRGVEFRKHYPVTASQMEGVLINPPYPGMLIEPEPYAASAVFTQPVWIAANIFGFDKILSILLETLIAMREIHNYNNFTVQLLKSSMKYPRIYIFFKNEFEIRNLNN